MSTRSQIKVTNGEQSLTLYHHTDGYPSGILPLLREAWEKYGKGWEGARVYKVASMLCAVDPVIFEPLDYHTLHADIEYYYVIDCKGTSHVGTEPVWTIKAYSVAFDFDKVIEDEKCLTLLGEFKVDKIDDDFISKLEGEGDPDAY